MNAIYLEPNNLDLLVERLEELALDVKTKAVLFLMADKDHYSEKVLSSLLKKHKKPIIGGIFPEIIFLGQRKISGVLLLPLSFELKTQVFDLTSDPETFINELASVQKDSFDSPSALFVYVDALSQNKELFIESLFNFFGINPTYIGGGTGSLSFKPFPNIIDNNGIHSNAAVIGWANKKIALGVAHGWEPISEPLKVTEADRNKLESINWKPAFEVYKEIVELHSKTRFTNDNFFHIAKSYPLGIAKMDAEMVVRDPFMVSNNTLHLVDIVNEGEYVNILHGNIDSLLAGAKKAREISFSKLENKKDVKSVFCIDCISRVLFMEDAFNQELELVGGDCIVNGVLSIGEIANSGESFLEIYNKAIALCIW